MHELSLCQNLIDQLVDLATLHHARSVARVKVQIGVLSGVEALLLESAFTIARMDTVAEDAELVTEVIAPLVHCAACGAQSETSLNKLCCLACGSEQTTLIRGDELILAQVELAVDVLAPSA